MSNGCYSAGNLTTTSLKLRPPVYQFQVIPPVAHIPSLTSPSRHEHEDFLPSDSEYFSSLFNTEPFFSAASNAGSDFTWLTDTNSPGEEFSPGCYGSPEPSKVEEADKNSGAELVKKKRKAWGQELQNSDQKYYTSETSQDRREGTAKDRESIEKLSFCSVLSRTQTKRGLGQARGEDDVSRDQR
ncbi:hypothetical protein HOY80DRAFT_1051124 [Tuber brumale]|nr:hypothetical protein HOY80DRAFT_1051124 [Tuber brumale]